MNIYMNNSASGVFGWDQDDIDEDSPYRQMIVLENSGLSTELEMNMYDADGHLVTADENDVDEDMIC